MVSPKVYARSAYSSYAGRTPLAGLVLAHPVQGAVERPYSGSRIDPMEVSSEAWAGCRGQHADPRNHGYGAEWGMHFEPTAHYGFSAGIIDTVDRAVARMAVGAIRPHEYDGRYLYTSRSSEAGAFERSECTTHDHWSSGAGLTRATEYNRYSEVA